MLTDSQIGIITDVMEVNESPNTVTFKNRAGISQHYSYGLISASRRDLDKLRDRHLLSFRRGYCEPTVTDKGSMTLQQVQILSMLDQGLLDSGPFIDEIIAEDIDLSLKDVQNLLIDLKEQELIDGYYCISSEEDRSYRLINIWITNTGKNALTEPDDWWNSIRFRTPAHPQPIRSDIAHTSIKSPSPFAQTSSSTGQQNLPPDSLSKTLTYIEALKELMQSLPEDRCSEATTILTHLHQVVMPSERQCA